MPNETDNEEEGARGNVSRRNFFERIGVAGAVAATGPVPAAAQTPAMSTEVSADDRFRIQDVLRSYVWANDSGSVERVVAAFTPDGIVQPATGERIPVRRWAWSETFAQPGRRGRQHWVQHIIFDRTADGVTVALLLEGGAGACLKEHQDPKRHGLL
jgi:SnoaL-like domain